MITYEWRVLIDHLINNLMDSDTKHFQRQIDSLVERNIALYEPPIQYGFVYGTTVYKHTLCDSYPNQNLHDSLKEEMRVLEKHREQVKNDRFLISQMIGILTKNSKTIEEALGELPDVLIDFLPAAEWQGIVAPIDRHPARSIQGDPNMMIAYEKILLRIHYYAGMRYIV